MKAVIVDDEIASIEILEWLIQKNAPQLQVVKTFTSPLLAIKYLQQNPPDILFLDIQMEEMTGFGLLKQFPNIDFEVIFVTAYDQYALQALKANALDYLMKPVDRDDFLNAIQRLQSRKSRLLSVDLKQIIDQIKFPASKKIAISTSKSFDVLNPYEILYCESDGNYTKIHLIDGSFILVSKTLRLVEEFLPSGLFVRIHNSVIVNVDHVKKFVREDGGYLVLDNGKTLEVGKSRRDDLMNMFNKF